MAILTCQPQKTENSQQGWIMKGNGFRMTEMLEVLCGQREEVIGIMSVLEERKVTNLRRAS